MNTISHKDLSLSIDNSGTGVQIVDLRRNQPWRLEPSTVRIRDREGAVMPESVSVAKVSSDRIDARIRAGGGEILISWILRVDHIEVELRSCPDTILALSLGGCFLPSEGAHTAALPFYQGVLCRGSRAKWEDAASSGGHGAWSMAMGAMIAAGGALLVTQETTTDWSGVRGENERGPYFFFEQTRCDVEGWSVRRSVRLYPVDRDLTSICKRFRARLKERGAFVSWEEKIARKPVVKDLFGALMAFIGYNATDEIDYLACAQKVRAMGFDRVFYYPARMAAYSTDFKMGGDDPIWLSDQTISALKNIGGVHLSPWMWSVEAQDTPQTDVQRIGCRTRDGKLSPTWQIDKQIWYIVCTPYEIRHVAKRFDGDMKEMDWVHYDVGAQRPGKPCHSREHQLHGNRPMGLREAHEWSQKLLGWEHNGNRVVSAEGFVDYFARAYDIGSTKVIPAWGDRPFIPVPMSMLVFHDSCINDWWEIDNYNKLPFTHPCNRFGTAQSGFAAKKAAMDALYGLPPNVFPFGKQYAWRNIETRETFSFIVKLDDAEVQEALRVALPVCRLHRDIGMQELVSFEMLTDDCAVQSTVFGDGTRIVANVSDTAREYRGEKIAPDSWKRVRE